MNYLVRPNLGRSSRLERFPWLIFLFIAAVFFLSFHNLEMSRRGIEAFNASTDEIVTGVAEGSLSKRIALLSLGIFAIVKLIEHRGIRLRINDLLGWTMAFFTGWAILSLVWAEDRALSFRRLVILLILCLAAAAIARCFTLRRIVLLTFFCSIVFLLIGVSAELALGTFRPFASGYRFAGTLHPNHQGINCALLLLSGVAAADGQRFRRILFRVCALLGFVFLILTGSRTASAAGVLALAVYLTAVSSWRARAAAALGLVMAVGILALAFGPTFLPDIKNAVMFGRDDFAADAFHPRTGIWDEVGGYIQERPILGYGYGGFWNQHHINEVSASQNWGVGAGHSAYVDCILDLGAVGLAAYVLVLLGGIVRSFTFHKAQGAPYFAFSGSLLIFCLADGLLESAMLEGTFLMFLSMTVLVRIAFACSPEADQGAICES